MKLTTLIIIKEILNESVEKEEKELHRINKELEMMHESDSEGEELRNAIQAAVKSRTNQMFKVARSQQVLKEFMEKEWN